MGYLQIVFGLTVFTTYQILPIFQDERDGGTSFKRISISGAMFQGRHSCWKNTAPPWDMINDQSIMKVEATKFG